MEHRRRSRIRYAPQAWRGLEPRRPPLYGRFLIYDAASGKLIAPLQDQHEYNPAGTVAWSPDGRSIAISGNGVQIKVWDAVAGKRVYTLQGRIAGQLAFSPDSRRLAAADFLERSRSGRRLRLVRRRSLLTTARDVRVRRLLIPATAWSRRPTATQNIRVWDVATRKTVQGLDRGNAEH